MAWFGNNWWKNNWFANWWWGGARTPPSTVFIPITGSVTAYQIRGDTRDPVVTPLRPRTFDIIGDTQSPSLTGVPAADLTITGALEE